MWFFTAPLFALKKSRERSQKSFFFPSEKMEKQFFYEGKKVALHFFAKQKKMQKIERIKSLFFTSFFFEKKEKAIHIFF
jgi:hypothetical protein